tara:strand:+ start:448 stop:681 length:234 start_codon:yes stop_codon:yes gene_type:complete
MNYIHKLQNEIEDLKSQIEAYEEVNRDIRSYLTLDKFKNDTTVQTGDIFHRLDNYHFYYERIENRKYHERIENYKDS